MPYFHLALSLLRGVTSFLHLCSSTAGTFGPGTSACHLPICKFLQLVLPQGSSSPGSSPSGREENQPLLKAPRADKGIGWEALTNRTTSKTRQWARPWPCLRGRAGLRQAGQPAHTVPETQQPSLPGSWCRTSSLGERSPNFICSSRNITITRELSAAAIPAPWDPWHRLLSVLSHTLSKAGDSLFCF